MVPTNCATVKTDRRAQVNRLRAELGLAPLTAHQTAHDPSLAEPQGLRLAGLIELCSDLIAGRSGFGSRGSNQLDPFALGEHDLLPHHPAVAAIAEPWQHAEFELVNAYRSVGGRRHGYSPPRFTWQTPAEGANRVVADGRARMSARH
jgi:hypothetical protein